MPRKTETEPKIEKVQAVEKAPAKTSASKFPVWPVVSVILIIVIAASILTHGFSFTGFSSSGKQITPAQAEERAVAFVNELLDGQATATASNVTEANGLYKINLVVGTQEYDSYITKDGSVLFPSGYDLSDWTPSTASPNATNTSTSSNTPATTYPLSDKPVVKFFVMAFCPYGQQAETGLKGAYDVLGDSVTWEPHYVIYDHYQTADYCLDANQTYCSMHGRGELNEDIRQMCIAKNYNTSTWWNYVSAINSQCSASNVDSCWTSIANSTGINVTKISECQSSDAVTLLAAEKALNEQYSVRGSPTIFLNGQSYSGSRSPDAFKTAICSAFNTEPAACGQVLNSTTSTASGGCGA